MTSATLTPPQLQALLDILLHHETYAEVQSFRDPEAIDRYGYPFIDSPTGKKGAQHESSSTPLLQLLLTRVVLPIPGMRDVSPDFWGVQFKGLMKRFGHADLSESYDKGTLGSRKRLATAASVVHETVTRGLLTGVDNDKLPDMQSPYDSATAKGLTKAWQDAIRQLIYGDLIDEIFDYFTTSADIEEHSPGMRAAVQFAILYIATFLHNIFVLSAEGPYLLKLLDNVHKLIPYTVIGQTLRVGNAATMINGLVRLFLAKVSVGAISNWIGLTSNAADGMNLMQRIISMVLDWDKSDFRKQADSIKRGKDRPSNEMLAAIDRHLSASHEHHGTARQKSIQEQKSIVLVILESQSENLAETLTEKQHTQCLEYYAAQLAIRDREQIIEVICRSNPDLVTAIVREGVAVFEPMLREIHKHVDIRKHLGAFQTFLTDFIQTAKPKKQDNDAKETGGCPPSIEDFVALLQRNRHLVYAYLHDVARDCPDLRDTWRSWAKAEVQAFRQRGDSQGTTKTNETDPPHGIGDMSGAIQELFDSLPDDKRPSVRDTVEAHARYLDKLDRISATRMQRIIDGIGKTQGKYDGDQTGPGVYAAKWEALLDDTLITPDKPSGPPRRGEEVKGLKALGKTEAVSSSETWDSSELADQESKGNPRPPNVSIVIEALSPQFKTLVADMAKEGLPL
ncbi:PX-associated-domain-containing protein [Xylariaceae sp. FL0016]|nr:PX-associated-domain-containing protein [Xylariaceae sp. FL0016]